MRIVLDTTGGRLLVSATGLPSLRRALSMLFQTALRDVSRGAVPPLYETDVEYRREPKFKSAERWQRPLRTALNGYGDCEDLAAWRAAEAVVSGENPLARPAVIPIRRGLKHVVVNHGGGIFEDPSRVLGMNASQKPRARIRRFGDGYKAQVIAPAGAYLFHGQGLGPTASDALAGAVDSTMDTLELAGVEVESMAGDDEVGFITDLIGLASSAASNPTIQGAVGGALGKLFGGKKKKKSGGGKAPAAAAAAAAPAASRGGGGGGGGGVPPVAPGTTMRASDAGRLAALGAAANLGQNDEWAALQTMARAMSARGRNSTFGKLARTLLYGSGR